MSPPVTLQEHKDLIRNLIGIFGSLALLHNRISTYDHPGSTKAQILHNDLKPSNILARPKENGSSRFDVDFLVADLDRSSEQISFVGSVDPGGMESGVSQAYGG